MAAGKDLGVDRGAAAQNPRLRIDDLAVVGMRFAARSPAPGQGPCVILAKPTGHVDQRLLSLPPASIRQTRASGFPTGARPAGPSRAADDHIVISLCHLLSDPVRARSVDMDGLDLGIFLDPAIPALAAPARLPQPPSWRFRPPITMRLTRSCPARMRRGGQHGVISG